MSVYRKLLKGEIIQKIVKIYISGSKPIFLGFYQLYYGHILEYDRNILDLIVDSFK